MTFLYTNIWGECSINSGWEWMSSYYREPFFLLNWYARTNTTADKAMFERWAHRSKIACISMSTARELWTLPVSDLLRSGPRFEEGVDDRWKAADPIIVGPGDQFRLRLEGSWTESPPFSEERGEMIYFHLEGLRFMGDQKEWSRVMRGLHMTGTVYPRPDDVAERIALWLESAHPDFAPLADGIREGRWKTTPIARRS